MTDSATEQERGSPGIHTLGSTGCSLDLNATAPPRPRQMTHLVGRPSPQPHRVEFLVVATELTQVVVTGCNLGAQGEHQHTDGGQPHEDAPAGERGGGEHGMRRAWGKLAPRNRAGCREVAFLNSKPTDGHRASVWDDE